MPTADVPTDDVAIVGDNSTEEEQLSNSESHCKAVKITRVETTLNKKKKTGCKLAAFSLTHFLHFGTLFMICALMAKTREFQSSGTTCRLLSKAFTTAFLFGEEVVKEYLSLESFLAYLSSDERELDTAPRAKQVKDVVLEISHKEVIQTPRYIVDSWSTPFSAFHRFRQQFSSTDCLLEMFARGKPTNKKIVTFHANLKT
ncbi:hypothetical protein pdam_00009812 [Pocillopora damicornis]|uniref:Uncharacterized protein n=1 Tax=Pocillopora damicornis TaxID=46731 RepID=A0A3M6V0P2_POCDA|nr:hypothetical protein pdam_00009812 [Pocillopora damicornis]